MDRRQQVWRQSFNQPAEQVYRGIRHELSVRAVLSSRAVLSAQAVLSRNDIPLPHLLAITQEIV
jgi:hypothetical protein